MSHTNNTTHYSFPQFVANDTPAWLTDVNQAFSSIDAEIFARQQTIASNTDAITGHTAQIQTINDKLSADELDIANLTGRVASAETNIANNTSLLSTHTTQISSLANQITQLQDNIVTVILDSATWVNNEYIISNTLIKLDNIITMTYPTNTTDADYQILVDANIRAVEQTTGALKIKALGDVPTSNVTIQLIIKGGE